MSDPLESLTDAELIRAATPSVTTGGGPTVTIVGQQHYMEMNRRLGAAIVALHGTTERLTRQLIGLTFVLVVFTVAIFALAIVTFVRR